MELPAVEMKFGKSLNLADRLGAKYAVILGDDELAAEAIHGEAAGRRRPEETFGVRLAHLLAAEDAMMTALDLLGDWKRTHYAAICARPMPTRKSC